MPAENWSNPHGDYNMPRPFTNEFFLTKKIRRFYPTSLMLPLFFLNIMLTRKCLTGIDPGKNNILKCIIAPSHFLRFSCQQIPISRAPLNKGPHTHLHKKLTGSCNCIESNRRELGGKKITLIF